MIASYQQPSQSAYYQNNNKASLCNSNCSKSAPLMSYGHMLYNNFPEFMNLMWVIAKCVAIGQFKIFAPQRDLIASLSPQFI